MFSKLFGKKAEKKCDFEIENGDDEETSMFEFSHLVTLLEFT
jgi:hypothetical protein